MGLIQRFSLISYANQNRTDPNLSALQKLFSTRFEKMYSYSIVVNGKSDGNSLGDFSTMFFMIPYLYSPQKTDLETVVIGLGTGISAGAYTRLEDVKNIEVLEISPFVIKAIESTPPELNFHVMKSKKVKIIETDAFRYFTKNKKKFDIILSEPSNPWVLGVENLFTLEFYKLIFQSLNAGGIFGQWLYTYDMDLETMEIVIKTIKQVFPHANLYKIGHQDILIVASSKELKALSKDKFNQPFVKKFYEAMGFKEVDDLYLSQILNSYTFDQIAKMSLARINNLNQPQLIYRTNKAMFLGRHADPFQLKNKFQPEKKEETQKIKTFNKHKNTTTADWEKRCLPASGFNFLCSSMRSYSISWTHLKDEKINYTERFAQYLFLRKQGFISYNKKIMDNFFDESIKQKNKNLDVLSKYISEKMKNKDYEGANKDSLAFKNNNLINANHYNNFKIDLQNIRKAHKLLENGRNL